MSFSSVATFFGDFFSEAFFSLFNKHFTPQNKALHTYDLERATATLFNPIISYQRSNIGLAAVLNVAFGRFNNEQPQLYLQRQVKSEKL